jgi:magnesium transporter
MTDSDAAPVQPSRLRDRFFRSHRKLPGEPPGTLVHTGPTRSHEARIQTMVYRDGQCEDLLPTDVADVFPLREPPWVTWVNVDGVHDVELVRALGEKAGFHPLLLEDIVATSQRPKHEEYDSQMYLVLRMLEYDQELGEVNEDQLSLVLGSNYVFTFQEEPGDMFDRIRDRLRAGKGPLPTRHGADFLAYALMDAVVDEYFAVLENIGDRIEDLEAEVAERPEPRTLSEIHNVKRELIVMRRAVWPLRDVFNTLIRDESQLISAETRVFLRDAYDHAVRVIDTVETLRDLLSGMVDLYVSTVSHRLNEIIKVLTIISTIFIPLTFIVGVYGMNFVHMPEIEYRWSYPILWGIMILVAGAMMVFFRRKRWI